MSIQQWSEGIVLAVLEPEPELGKELSSLYEEVFNKGNHVVIDFSEVDFIVAENLSKLLRVKKYLYDGGSRLILCNVSPVVRGIFTITGLAEVFEIVDDKDVALATLQIM